MLFYVFRIALQYNSFATAQDTQTAEVLDYVFVLVEKPVLKFSRATWLFDFCIESRSRRLCVERQSVDDDPSYCKNVFELAKNKFISVLYKNSFI